MCKIFSTTIDLGADTKFNKIVVFENSDSKENEFEYNLCVSNDNSVFTTVSTYIDEHSWYQKAILEITKNEKGNKQIVSCKSQVARYVKFNITKLNNTENNTKIRGIQVVNVSPTQKDIEWHDFLYDTTWQKTLDISTVGHGSLIADSNGGTLQLNVTDRPNTNDVTDNVTYSVDDSTIAIVSSAGLVTAKKAGRVNVTARLNGSNKTGNIKIDIMGSESKYKNTWEDLQSKYTVPQWYTDAKFGIFFHWGAYSVSAYTSEWFPRFLYLGTANNDERKFPEFFFNKFGKYDVFGNEQGYKDIIKDFKGENFNADEWAKIAKKAGAKFIVPVAEHHDGLAMYDTKYTRWNTINVGPKKNIVKELKNAAENNGLKFGVSNHFRENEWFFERTEESLIQDANNEQFFDIYNNSKKTYNYNTHMQKWFNRALELVDKFDPDFILFDWMVTGTPYTKDFLTYYYNKAEKTNPDGVVMTIKMETVDGANVYGVERGQSEDIRDRPWEANTSISWGSWGYIDNDKYKTSTQLIDFMADVVSKNGTMLLNIGPDSHGNIPKQAIATLNEMGKWLRINGDAIYSTKPWTIYGEGSTKITEGTFNESGNFSSDDFRFTKSKDDKNLYVIGMIYPDDNKIKITKINSLDVSLKNLKSLKLLGSDDVVKYSQSKDGLEVALPKKPSGNVQAYVLKFKFNVKVPDYPVVKNSITVIGGTSNLFTAKEGTSVRLSAFPAKDNELFNKWVFISGSGKMYDTNREFTLLTMPDKPVTVKATYKDKDSYNVPYNLATSKKVLSTDEVIEHRLEGPIGMPTTIYTYDASNLTDGNYRTCWAPKTETASATIDIGKVCEFNEIRINEIDYESTGYKTKEYDIQISNDNSSFKSIKKGSTMGRVCTVMFDDIQSARYIKFVINKTTDGMPARFSQFELYNQINC